MPSLESRGSIARCCLGLVLLTTASSLGAQEAARASPHARILNAVIRYRTAWLADYTPFEACSVARWAGSPAADLLRGVANPERVLLGRSGEGCVRGRLSPDAEGVQHRVVLDSVVVSDSIATVRLSVRHGEYTHYEAFSVVPQEGGTRWGVREARIWGAIQSSPPPRRPSP
ncbi:MAG TPA: hypothetical protein VF541_09435 [Longimicrobium sp.]